jgi:hypothetical protein
LPEGLIARATMMDLFHQERRCGTEELRGREGLMPPLAARDRGSYIEINLGASKCFHQTTKTHKTCDSYYKPV